MMEGEFSEMGKFVLNMKKKSFFAYVIVAVLTIIMVSFVYQLWKTNIFKVPFTYTSDGLIGLMSTKIMIDEGGLGWASDRLGAPFGFDTYDASQSTYLPVLLKKLMALFSSNWIFVVNISYLSGFVIVSCVAFSVLKKMGIDLRAAVMLSVLYSCVPYHFFRGEAHFSLSFYISVPIAVYYILRMMKEDILKGKSYREWIKYFIAMIIIGTGGLYYAYFTCLFLCVAMIYVFINENNLFGIKVMAFCVVIISGTVLVGYVPTIIYTATYGRNTEGIVRSAAQVEALSLKLAQLILPITGHRIPFLSRLKNKFNSSYNYTENDFASLGLFFSIGFIFLLLFLWTKQSKNKKTCLHEVACLNMAALLYASVGGFISVQGIVFDKIRAGNRISIFIAFFSCICLGIIVTACLKKYQFKNKYVTTALACILIFGVFDNTKSKYFDADAVYANIENDYRFVQQIEELENGEGTILQLPIMRFPESDPIVKMQNGDHFIGYLYSDNLRWSSGITMGRKGSKFFEEFNKKGLSAGKLVSKAARMGYTGIYIDKDGYVEEEYVNLKESMKNVLNLEPVECTDGSKIYFSLKKYIEQNKIEKNYCSYEFGAGIYEQESDGNTTWNWADRECEFKLYNWSDEGQKVRMKIGIRPFWEKSYKLIIKSEEDEEEIFNIIPGKETECVWDVNVKPGYNSFQMTTDAPLMQGTGDVRNLCYMITDYETVMKTDVDVIWKNGVYEEEQNAGEYWRWSEQNGEILLNSRGEKNIVMNAVIQSTHDQTHYINWNCNDRQDRLFIQPGENKITIELALHNGENKLSFQSDIPSINVGGTDDRDLHFKISNYNIVTVGKLHEKND